MPCTRPALRRALGAVFIAAGTLHLVHPGPFLRIMPPWIPAHEAAVAVSGVAELLGGVGMLDRRTSPKAALGLAALLVAVFPANVWMAMHADRFSAVPAWALWARLPLQPALITIVLTAAPRRADGTRPWPGRPASRRS